MVLINLLKRALALLPREQAEAMAEEVGVEYGRAMAEAMGDVGESQRSFRAALHMVADAMTAHGFDAHVAEPASGAGARSASRRRACASSPSTAPSAAPRSSTPSSARSTAAWSGA